VAAKSKFKLNATFKSDIKKLRVGVLVAAEKAMEDGIAMAELEAQEQARWAAIGSNYFMSDSGDLWEWGVSGMSRAAIAGYVSSKNSKPKLPTISMPDTLSFINGRQLGKARKHIAKPPRPVSAEMHKVKAVLTRYGPYAGYLEGKEIAGTAPYGDSGSAIDAGDPIIKAVMARWKTFIVPTIVIPRFKQEMARVISTLGK
jgi:hypothetical protein